MISLSFSKAWVKGSTWIPVFDVESTFNVGTLPKKVTNFMMGIILLYLDGVGYNCTCFVYVDLHFPFNQVYLGNPNRPYRNVIVFLEYVINTKNA